MGTVKDGLLAKANEVIGSLQQENAQLKMELENVNYQLRGSAAPSLDCVGYLTIKHMANGGLQVSGNMGDIEYALGLLEHAKDSIRSHHKTQASNLVAPDGNPLVSVPNRDVELKQSNKFPTRPFGDMQPGERGDMPK